MLAQQTPILSGLNTVDKIISQIGDNKAINADSAFKLFSNWSQYPVIEKTGIDYMYYYTDSVYGKIPLRVFIPRNYKNDIPNSCILLLHGAVGGVTFNDIDTVSKFDDLLFSLLKNRTSIIIRPVADPDKKFDWVVDRSHGNTNLTFKVLADIMVSIKKVLNINDNKIFAFGHSDGSDGAVAMGVYSPNQFAGIIAYNSMLTELFAKDYYIRNIINRPLYDVHSDKDDLRPIQQNRAIMQELNKIDNDIIYKEYIGYQHYDKHLDKDIPYTDQFINANSRNPFKTRISWEASSANNYNSCDWLKITGVNAKLPPATWYQPLEISNYNKRTMKFEVNENYYTGLNPSAVIRASFNNNVFNIQTSRATALELMISPVMVNLEEPVVVVINGSQVFSGKVLASKQFITNEFLANFDKQALWVTSLKLKVN
jgi:predicted esterase